MAVKKKGIPAGQFIGASTDTQPTHALFVAGTIDYDVGPGATFYETDTGIMYLMGTDDTWVEKDTIVRLEASASINIGDVELITNDGDEVTDDTADAVRSLLVTPDGGAVVDDTANAVKSLPVSDDGSSTADDTANAQKVLPVSDDGTSTADNTANAQKALLVDAAGVVIEKAEDAAHSSGDKGIMALGVRKDAPTAMGAAEDYVPPQFDEMGNMRVVDSLNPMYGQPEIRCNNTGWGKWESKALNAKYNLGSDTNRQFRYGDWAVHLNGGAQAGGEAWASLWIPVNDLPLADVLSLAFTYYKFLDGTAHIGVYPPVIALATRNPDDHDERADITQTSAYGGTVTEGWHENLIEPATTASLMWYGNNIDSDIGEGAATLSTLATFQADKAFKDHTVYMLKVFFGYWSGTVSTGDVWIGGVRVSGENIPLVPDQSQKAEVAESEKNMFGEPVLMAGGEGKALWEAGWHYGASSRAGSGFVARLIGGKQSAWNDFAKIRIPVNNMRVPDLKTLRWQYWMENAESYGVNIGIHTHNPYDFDMEAEISQLPSISGLDKAVGYNSHELNQTTDQFFYYGTDSTSELDEGPPNYYGWDDFVADEQFNTWVIDSIYLNYGCQTGDAVFDDVMVFLLEINGQNIPLKPSLEQMALEKHYIDNDIPISSGIYTPRRIHVKPQFDLYGTTAGTGIGHLVKGAIEGIDNQIGGAIKLGSAGAGTNVNTVAIPVNIPLNKIDTLTYLEKMSQALEGQNLRGIYFRLDADRSGAYEPENDSDGDMYLGNITSAIIGATTWTKVNPLSTATFTLRRWHTAIATPDGGVGSGGAATFATYAATDIGDYIVKEIGWAYTGAAVGDWGMVACIVINGIEYILDRDTPIVKERVAKTIAAAGEHIANDVVGDSAVWTFNMGGQGYLTKAVAALAVTGKTPRLHIELYSKSPGCNLTDDSPATGPFAVDLPYFIGFIDIPAMTYTGAGMSFSMASPSTYGNLPLAFNCPTLYGVVSSPDITTYTAVALAIELTAEMLD